MKRRFVYLWALEFVAAQIAASTQFDFGQARERARALGQQPFVQAPNRIPESLLNLTYVEYASIRFDSRQALWVGEGLPFQIEFFMPGFYHKQVVAINELTFWR